MVANNRAMVASNRITEVNSQVTVNNKVTAAHQQLPQPQLQQPVTHKVTINNNRMEEVVDRTGTSKSENVSIIFDFDGDFRTAHLKFDLNFRLNKDQRKTCSKEHLARVKRT